MIGHLMHYVNNYWYQTILHAAMLLFIFCNFEEHGMRGLIKKLNVGKVLFTLYLAIILCIAIFGRTGNKEPLTSVFDNFSPFDTEAIENTLAFIPLTFLYLIIKKPPKPVKIALGMSFAISAFIEVSQLIGHVGLFQLSDLMYNTLGGTVGGGVYLLTMFLVKKWKDKVNRGRRENHL